MRVCNQVGCPILIPKITRDGRCPDHRRQRERQRGSASTRGYGRLHQSIRAEYQGRMDRGELFECWRCGIELDPSAWHLGHDDGDRSRYQGPECIPCNTATAGRLPRGQTVPPAPTTGDRGGGLSFPGRPINLNGRAD